MRFNRILIPVVMAALPMMLNAIKPLESGVNEYIALLEATGRQMFAFDVSEFSDSARTVMIELREYAGDTLTAKTIKFPVKSVEYRDVDDMIMSGFDADDFEDAEKGIFRTLKQINVGFSRAPGDSVATIVIDIPEVMTAPIVRKLRPVTNEEGEPQYFYAPFACRDFSDAKSGAFTPLAVLASGWFDPKINRLRACGNGNSVTKESPHYFVVGISVKNNKR